MNVLFLGYPNACLERLEIGKDRTRVPVFAGPPPSARGPNKSKVESIIIRLAHRFRAN